jgi:hypothetical protein
VPREATAKDRTATVAIRIQKGNQVRPTRRLIIKKSMTRVGVFDFPLEKYIVGSKTARITTTLRIT